MYVSISQFIQFVKTQFDKNIKRIRFDNETEFLNSLCHTLFTKLGIIHQTSCAYNPRHNRVTERKHKHILEVTRA